MSLPHKPGQADELVQYLLGLLPPEDAERLDEASIVDDDIAARLRRVEDDLVDSYVRGQLSGETLAQFESHYLASPRRRERVAFAGRFLRAVDRVAGPVAADPPRAPAASKMISTLAVAATLSLVAGGALLLQTVRLGRGLRVAQSERVALDQRARDLERQVGELRAANATATKELERMRESAATVVHDVATDRARLAAADPVARPRADAGHAGRGGATGIRAAPRIERVPGVSGRAQGPGGQHHRLAQRLDRREVVGWSVRRPGRRSRPRVEAAALLARSQRAAAGGGRSGRQLRLRDRAAMMPGFDRGCATLAVVAFTCVVASVLQLSGAAPGCHRPRVGQRRRASSGSRGRASLCDRAERRRVRACDRRTARHRRHRAGARRRRGRDRGVRGRDSGCRSGTGRHRRRRARQLHHRDQGGAGHRRCQALMRSASPAATPRPTPIAPFRNREPFARARPGWTPRAGSTPRGPCSSTR